MRFLITLIASSLLVGGLFLFGTKLLNNTSSSETDVLFVYNWGEYIDPELIKQFTEETGIRVVYETFDSNEAMLVKIKQKQRYDVVFPSEYTVEKMKKDNLLLPIDPDKIPNIKNIDERFLGLSFDPGNEYSLPYFWGTVGILYNPETTTGMDFSTWDSVWDESLLNDVLLLDGARETIGFVLNSEGHSLNSTNKEELDQAKQKLEKLSPNVRGIVGDEIASMMKENEAKVAVVWSGMAMDIMYENEDLIYTIPQEGTNLWFDTMAIPSSAKNIDGAHQFINFLLDKNVALQNTDWVGYATPNQAAFKELDEEVKNAKEFYPDKETMEKLEVYRDLGPEWTEYYNELLLEFKMSLD
ncbi:ABC transporter substrate-binding protein [Phocicoccus pinnipedialis]|uniref:Spermidine/putrescine-binding periplasmic protein n=1 Tax=Phocicoccus pinnipedialis TaxID=110845 RepID=A0A6V7RHZ4_9BACL|nr:ABC transporter substrate-binding protein [Jeotgalicoccus pinnipedialis]MBP1939000.1 spermidine/putrescine transport system substrate-binding protein [Jeotgalicoccus pinnipedialis]CAD2077234.1 Spermidine/putrescine-binding periplasmic protein precursor [Jeotgalicoccus pinnipedialis]